MSSDTLEDFRLRALAPVYDNTSPQRRYHRRHSLKSSQDYADMVMDFSHIPSKKSLYSGLRFDALAKFLAQPYKGHTAQWKYHPTTAAHHQESFPLVMSFNWQDGPENRPQYLSLLDQLETVSRSAGSLVVLKGYPSAEWLNSLGAKFRIDPDIFQRHLCFWSESGTNISRRDMAPRLPSAQADTLMLRIPTIGFAIEQVITINVSLMKNGGWQSIVWSDVGRSLDEGSEGPWRLRMPRKPTEVTYQPISIFKPRMALEGGAPSRQGSEPHVRPQSASILFEEYDRDLDTAQAAVDPLYALSPVFRFALFSEMALLDTLETNVRSELTHSAVTAQESPTMSNLLYTQQILKRHIDSLQDCIDFVERFRKRPAYQPIRNSTNGAYTEEMVSMLDDFRAALCRAEALYNECVQGIGIVAHNATIRESQKAFAEAKSVTKLTKLALVFVPLSFTTSAFGMNFQPPNKVPNPSLVTVFASRPEIRITKCWIRSVIRHFEKHDDVFRQEFLEGLVVIGNSRANVMFQPGDCFLLGSTTKTKWIYVTPSNSHPNKLKPGPHYLYGGLLRPVCRLYDDAQYCFLTTLKPQNTAAGSFRQLHVAGTRYQTLGVAVPSRLPACDDGNQYGLSQMRIAVKDLFQLRGLKTSLCNADYYRRCPPAQATAIVVQRLVDAGAQILGLTKLSSMIAREEPLEAVDFQTPFNPRGDGYQSPAGSSSGSAVAVASYDWLDCAIGSDTSGSGRRPALVNGVYQFRPTHSAVSMNGMVQTFLRFDTPCVFARSLHVLESVLRAWIPPGETSVFSFDRPFKVVFTLDYFPVQNLDQMRQVKGFLEEMSTFVGAQVEEVSIQETWQVSPPDGVSDGLSAYLQDVISHTYFYSFYHSTDAFRAEFSQKYGRAPYVIPFVRDRWNTGAAVSDEQHTDGLHKLDIYRRWLLQHLFNSKKTLLVLPIANVEPNYRDVVNKSPPALADIDQLYLPPILGSPDIVLPIGEVEYQSKITRGGEYLPVAINLVAAPGEDFWLLNVARETLRRSGRQEDIYTGSRIYSTVLLDRTTSA
ncbi:amidase signature enzyme [Apiospora hydei]|uniref:Amidase signature enzyme n=1 Tax=Apiospora hydei TaxID=1337664 RepID=A0ABR1WLU9_9PEZI